RVFAERDWLLQRQSSWFEYSTSPCSLRTNRPGSSRFTRPVRPWRRRRSWMCCCFPRGSRRRSTIGAPSCFPAWASRESTSLRCTRIRPTARARSSMRPSGTVFSIRRTATSSTFDPDLSHLVALADLVDDVEALRHLTEDGVLAVEVRLGRVADEELRAPRVAPGVGHRQRPAHVPFRGGVDLALDVVAGAAGAGAERAAALDHKVVDHPVEREPVVEGPLHLLPGLGVDPFPLSGRQADEVGDGAGGVGLEQLGDDFPLGGLEVHFLGHDGSYWVR